MTDKSINNWDNMQEGRSENASVKKNGRRVQGKRIDSMRSGGVK